MAYEAMIAEWLSRPLLYCTVHKPLRIEDSKWRTTFWN